MALSQGCMSAICAAISLIALSASARVEVLFDSLSSPNSGVMGDGPFRFQDDASFATGASTFRATDIALLLNRDGTDITASGDTFTVSLEGGVPLADVTFLGPNLGLNIPGGSLLGSVTLPISVLSTNLMAEHFTQFANIALKPNSFYWIDLGVSLGPNEEDTSPIGWGTTDDNLGPGVSQGYNSSDATDFMFYPNNNGSVGGGPAFQMEVSGTAVPEPSTWVQMLVGFGGLGLIAYRRRAALTSNCA